MKYVNRHELSTRADNLRRNMTNAEKKLYYGFLRGYEVNFQPQKVIGRYIVDFYARKVRVCVELDGGQHYQKYGVFYDEQRLRFLEMNEIKVLRFSNNDIYENFEGVCEVIHNCVQKRRNDIKDADFLKLLDKR